MTTVLRSIGGPMAGTNGRPPMRPEKWIDDGHREARGWGRDQLLADPQLTSVEIAWASGTVLATRRHV
jgi:hypothetical protein